MKKLMLVCALAVCTTTYAQNSETVDQQFPSAYPSGVGEVTRGVANVLFSNGTVQTATTGGGAGGTDPVSVLTPPDSTFGATCNGAGGFRLADDFVVPAGGWTINKLKFYAYQTQAAPGGSTVSTLTGATVQIWNGIPGDVGSTVVFGDTTTNRMTATSFSGVWRVQSTALTNVQRGIMTAEVGNLTLNLPAGTYWVDYGITGSTASGPFCAPNQVVSASNNGRQLNAGTWAAVTDTGGARPLDFPFMIEGPSLPVAVTPTGTTLSFSLPTIATRTVAFTGAGPIACTATGPFTVAATSPTAPSTITVTATAAGTGVLTCVSGATTVATYPLVATQTVAAPTMNAFGMLMLLLGLGGLGVFAVRRYS